MQTTQSPLSMMMKKRLPQRPPLLAALISLSLLFTAPLATAEVWLGERDWSLDEIESAELPPTQIHHLPTDTRIHVAHDILIPAYVDHVVFSNVKEEVETCGKVETHNIKASLRVQPSKKERVIPAGSVFRISEVEQHLVNDRFLKPKKFAWYKMGIKSQEVRYMTFKVHSKRWNWFGRWNKLQKCGALKGYLAEDLKPLSGGFLQVFHVPEPTAIGNSSPYYSRSNRVSVERPKFINYANKIESAESVTEGAVAKREAPSSFFGKLLPKKEPRVSVQSTLPAEPSKMAVQEIEPDKKNLATLSANPPSDASPEDQSSSAPNAEER